ncbi:hypothetical protein EXIGLDRAFT_835208 [Exidia glandulosa HHB12029]|uniref:Uncharacterized protein n=1 Tax=Exidia glandulosa HHB12029 TaxID=1314781 RepID=A0A165J037_EXIGL|nr:hypothetical protein EXIGLDRAFT_835208 [Exidia glandulosa HHB12029]
MLKYRSATLSPGQVQEAMASFGLADTQRSPSASSESAYSTPRERPDSTFGLARARLELAASTRANAQIVELRSALANANRTERRRTSELARLRQDVKQLMSLISNRDDVLNRVDLLLDRSQARSSTRDHQVADLNDQLADTRDQMSELCELHRIHVAKLAMDHELEMSRLVHQHDADVRLERELVNDLRFELDARDEQLSSLRTALDVITSPHPAPVAFLNAHSPCPIFSLPATPATASPLMMAQPKTSPLTALKAQNASLTKTLAAKDDDIAILTANLVEARERLSELEEVVTTKDEQLDARERALREVRAQLELQTREEPVPTVSESEAKRSRAPSLKLRIPAPAPVSVKTKTPRIPELDIRARVSARTRSGSSASGSSTTSKLVASKSTSAVGSSFSTLANARPTLQSLATDRKPIPTSRSAPLINANASTKRPSAKPSMPALKPAAKIGMGAAPSTRAKTSVPARSASTSSGVSRVPSASRPLRASAAKERKVTPSALEDLTNSPKLGNALPVSAGE